MPAPPPVTLPTVLIVMSPADCAKTPTEPMTSPPRFIEILPVLLSARTPTAPPNTDPDVVIAMAPEFEEDSKA